MKCVFKEKDIENFILNYLNSKNIFCWKNQSVGIFDPKRKIYRKSNNNFHINGVADILGVMPNGKILAIEVKSRSGKLSQAQKTFLLNVKKQGGVAFVARSISKVMFELKEFLKKERQNESS